MTMPSSFRTGAMGSLSAACTSSLRYSASWPTSPSLRGRLRFPGLEELEQLFLILAA